MAGCPSWSKGVDLRSTVFLHSRVRVPSLLSLLNILFYFNKMFTDDIDSSSYRNGVPKKYWHMKDREFDDWEIPPWEVILDRSQCLGKGSFGHVFLGRWRYIDVAVKVVTDPNLSALFIEEFNTMTHVRHPNVVQLLGYVKEPFMIVMEYLPGGSLKSLNIEQALDILKALYYLHERRPTQIIHRDVKPSNIVLTKSGRPKLVDFGLSKCKDLENYENTIGSVGTKHFRAPEVKVGNYDHRIDIWSVGMVLLKFFGQPDIIKYINTSMIVEDPQGRKTIPEIIKFFENWESSIQPRGCFYY